MTSPAAELRGITKRFGAVVACDNVDLALQRGEIHGILGENGAGKSTLMKVLIGLVLPDAGAIRIDGEQRRIRDPAEAAELGIGMVHQHFSLVEPLTVWENVILGERTRLDAAAARRRVGEISERYGLAIDPDERISDLSAGLRQRVEIIKCLRRDPAIVILDEPTSVLTPGESEQLFEVLRLVVERENKAVALVSHKLDEVLAATDRITIMRAGAVVDRRETGDADAPGLARAMVGRPVSLRSAGAALGHIEGLEDGVAASEPEAGNGPEATGPPPVLSIRDARARGRDRRTLLDGLSLDVRPGEIVGVAGVEGNGQAALSDLLSSLLPLEGGTVRVRDERPLPGRPGAMAAAGVAVVPADRHESGCVLDMTVAENLTLVSPPRARTGRALLDSAGRAILDRTGRRAHAERLIEQFGIQTPGADAPMWSLSGGNQQRVVLARELSGDPAVLVAAQPTRGLDVGAIEYVSERLREAAADGVAVLLISTELEEVLDLADRIVVIFRGRIVGEMDRADLDVERLGLLMSGAQEAAAS
ncbi:MAG: ABC transporter ATP-binding protein [bacterium]|nr:ABC transporter ATP-binding protein [bacterium]